LTKYGNGGKLKMSKPRCETCKDVDNLLEKTVKKTKGTTMAKDGKEVVKNIMD
jgi:hypothetical protein